MRDFFYPPDSKNLQDKTGKGSISNNFCRIYYWRIFLVDLRDNDKTAAGYIGQRHHLNFDFDNPDSKN